MAVDYMGEDAGVAWEAPAAIGAVSAAILGRRGLASFAKRHFNGKLAKELGIRTAVGAAKLIENAPGAVWGAAKRIPGAYRTGRGIGSAVARAPYALRKPGVPAALVAGTVGAVGYAGYSMFGSPGPSPINLAGSIQHTETPDQMPSGMSLTPHQMMTQRQADQAKFAGLAGSTYGIVQGLNASKHGRG